ncbi:tetratricopeptide repeat protein [Brumimicrobium aurantiacum]|uniref:HTH luxR-type domain-containing protein n=1 Tax=Brumimicrobium aurantiacum TaxID=1737063 RepID=A0A3E1EX48_9FLAO|nr:tetratricopeptide repeat protein [Brumimicrobium aurantiacum]RFC54134.1 hypothetical protein DXU93_09095 [Brumimicrobium aurantiacum]
MKRGLLNIIFLLGFFMTSTESFAQNKEQLSDSYNKFKESLKQEDLEVFKKDFEQFANQAIEQDQDSLLIEGVLLAGRYFKNKNEYITRIKWFQYAIDSLCQSGAVKCVNIQRDFAAIYSYIGQYDKANELLFEGLNYLADNNHPLMAVFNHSLIAKNYIKSEQYELAEKHYLKAIELSKLKEKVFFTVHTYNNIGVFYENIKDYEKAITYYNKGIELLENRNLTTKLRTQLVLLKGNLGGVLLNQKSEEKRGLTYLYEDLNFNLKQREFNIAINAASRLALHYKSKKKYTKAIEVLSYCLENIDSSYIKNGHRNNTTNLYDWLFKMNLQNQNNKMALHYFEKYDALRTKNQEIRKENRYKIEKTLLENILTAQLNIQRQEIKFKDIENKRLKQKNEDFFYRIVLGSISFIILSVVIIFYSRKRIDLMRTKKELAENKFEVEKLEKEKAKIELNYKNKDITDFAIDISRKQEILTELKSKLNEIIEKQPKDTPTSAELKSLIRYANNNLIIDDQLNKFQQNVEEVNYQFFDVLKEKYPELTELDKNICGLIRLGLSNKEIATMRNVSYKAIRMSRYRIRKKLNLPPEVNIVEFLKSIE